MVALAFMTATLFVLNLMIGTHLLPATDVVRPVFGLPSDAGVDSWYGNCACPGPSPR